MIFLLKSLFCFSHGIVWIDNEIIASIIQEIIAKSGHGLAKMLHEWFYRSLAGSPGTHHGARPSAGSRQPATEGKIATHWHSTYFSNIKAKGESVNKLTIYKCPFILLPPLSKGKTTTAKISFHGPRRKISLLLGNFAGAAAVLLYLFKIHMQPPQPDPHAQMTGELAAAPLQEQLPRNYDLSSHVWGNKLWHLEKVCKNRCQTLTNSDCPSILL